MAIKPILFSKDMVRAILDGRKITTRRCVKFLLGENPNWTGYVKDGLMLYNGRNEPCCRKTPYQRGDILYVRETWCNANKEGVEPDYYYFADTFICEDYDSDEWTWRPSIHMPKEAARIWLKVTGVRVERLQNMNTDDFLAEGVTVRPEAWNDPENAYQQVRAAFIDIWDSTIRQVDSRKYGWDANPWVWVIEFKRCEKPEGV